MRRLRSIGPLRSIAALALTTLLLAACANSETGGAGTGGNGSG